MKLKNETYDKLKDFVTIWLPAFATFYLTISAIWGLPLGEAVAGTITAIATLLGALLKKSTNNYRAEKMQDNFNSESVEEMMGEDYEDKDITAEE